MSRASSLACAALDRGEIHPLFLNLRASRFEQAGNDEAALTDLRRAHDIDAADAAVGNALGLLLAKHGKFFEAIKAFEAALRAAPGFAPAHFNKGFACEAVGDLDMARECYEAAISLDPDPAEPFARLASLSARRGDFEEATRKAGEALARQPDHPAALQTLISVDIARGRAAEAELAIQALLGRDALSAHDRYLTMGLLGELREAQARFKEAYGAFSDGNREYYELNRRRFGANGTVRAAIDWLTAFYSVQVQLPDRGRSAANAERATHVFLVGFPRSGTTLLEQALASHPAVVTMEEKDAFPESVRAFMTGPVEHAKLWSANDRILEEYRTAYWRNVSDFGLSPNGKVFVDKHPFHTLKLPLIAALFPNAKILFAIRDPRDVVLGCLRARFRINPYMIELLRPGDAASFYAAYMRLADLYRQKLPLTVYDIRHEELVADFDAVCRSVCAFIGLDWSSSMRDFASRQQVRAVATPSARQLARGLSRAGIGRCRHYAEQLAPLMPVLMPWVERFGYTA